MSDEEIDNESINLSIATEWLLQIVDPNLLLVPQLLPNASRSNSITSIDYHMTNVHDNETCEV